jgi:hypothetical protein
LYWELQSTHLLPNALMNFFLLNRTNIIFFNVLPGFGSAWNHHHLQSWIRIRLDLKSWILILIKSMRIRNTGQPSNFSVCRFERERREAEQRHMRTIDQLENRIASLDVQNRDLLEVRYS